MNTPFTFEPETFEPETFEYDGAEGEMTWESEAPRRPVFVRSFASSDAECVDALTRAGKTRAEALAIINAQIAKAIRMLRVAARKLRRGNRSTQTRALFRRIFRVTPEFVPTWLKQTATIKDRGDVVAARCSGVANLLQRGGLRYFCAISERNCPDCRDGWDYSSTWACSSWGNDRVVCLNTRFWDDMKNGDFASTLSTLMHEPFHIYFGRYVTEHDVHLTGSSVGKFGGIRCILQFVFELNGQTSPPRDIDGCDATVVRS
jgi:hypothetical protein